MNSNNCLLNVLFFIFPSGNNTDAFHIIDGLVFMRIIQSIAFLLIGALGFLTLFSLTMCKSRSGDDLTADEVERIIHNPASAEADTKEYLTTISGGPFVFDAGEVKEGTVITHRFYFTNSGIVTLEKNRVQSGCGCTVAEFSSEKTAPGARDSITVSFDTQGFPGAQERTITLICNTSPKENLFTIKAMVLKD